MVEGRSRAPNPRTPAMTYRAARLGLALAALTPAVGSAQKGLPRPDPPAEKTDWPADYKPEVPHWQWPDSCVFADQDGPFVAVGGNRTAWGVYDLRTGKEVGTVEKGLFRGKVALSGDGTRL